MSDKRAGRVGANETRAVSSARNCFTGKIIREVINVWVDKDGSTRQVPWGTPMLWFKEEDILLAWGPPGPSLLPF